MTFVKTVPYELSLKGSVLVVPVVSIANLPQLAVDLLISSLALERVGILGASRYLIPVAGAREDGLPGITTPLELFGKQNSRFFLLQQRSPAIRDRKVDFVEALVKFAAETGFGSVLILSALDLSARIDAHMMSPAYHIVTKSTSESTAVSLLARLKETVPPFFPLGSKEGSSASSVSKRALPASGITVPLLHAFDRSQLAGSTGLIAQYVLEGDNKEDAYLLATVVARVLGLEQFNWKEPNSWKHGLFGSSHDQSLFG